MEESKGRQMTMAELEASKPAAPQEKKGRRQLYFHPELATVIASAEIAAKYFGVTPQTLSNWVKAGCPRHEYGYYNLKAVTEYRQRVTGQSGGPSPEDPRSLEEMSPQQLKVFYDQKLKAAQAEAAETRNQILSGKLLEREEVVRGLRDFAVILKRSLQGLGKKLSREASSALGPTEARRFGRLVTDTIDEALEQLALEGVYRYGDEDE